MKALRFEFRPQQVQISNEEILADLQYPTRKVRRGSGHRPAARRRGRA